MNIKKTIVVLQQKLIRIFQKLSVWLLHINRFSQYSHDFGIQLNYSPNML
jgi:hypothetical protein